MSEPEALNGLSCPRCGGMVAVPEGQSIILCPFCDLRSIVQGEHGIRRYQVPCRIPREQAFTALQRFLTSSWAISGSTRKEAQIGEMFLVHLPFRAAWGRGMGWAFGQKKVGSGDHKHYEPRELKAVKEMVWNTAACDVGEFGVSTINLDGRPLEAFQADTLHHSGMVFEPVGSEEEARQAARAAFENHMRSDLSLDRLEQQVIHIVRQRMGLVYYPLWVIRYQYRGRSFQVVVDGYDGQILYGKAPGNTLYRAGVLVGGMAAGAFVAVDLPMLFLSGNSKDGGGEGIIFLVIAGFALMYFSYRKFRYGEHYEYRRYKGTDKGNFTLPDGSAEIARRVMRDFRRFQ